MTGVTGEMGEDPDKEPRGVVPVHACAPITCDYRGSPEKPTAAFFLQLCSDQLLDG